MDILNQNRKQASTVFMMKDGDRADVNLVIVSVFVRPSKSGRKLLAGSPQEQAGRGYWSRSREFNLLGYSIILASPPFQRHWSSILRK